MDEILIATSVSNTHKYVLNTLEEVLESSQSSSSSSSSSSSVAAESCSSSSSYSSSTTFSSLLFNTTDSGDDNEEIEKLNITSPEPSNKKRKNKPAGYITDTGNSVIKRRRKAEGSHQRSSIKNHHRSSYKDVLSASKLMNSYPSSYDWHRMHGDIDLFRQELWPIERQLLKNLILLMTSEENLNRVKLSQQHKAPLHKV